jgi:predicted nucleotidyltransferase
MSFDAQASVAYWNARNRRDALALQARVLDARAEAHRLADKLRVQAGARRVVLFGSLAEGTVRSESFDVDLAYVGGCDRLCRSIATASAFPVDLVDYELLPPHVRQRVDRFGLEL